MTAGIVQGWAEFMRQVRRGGLESLPPPVLESLRTSFYDTIAVTYSGAGQAASRQVASYAAGYSAIPSAPGRSTAILGGATRPELAALVNGTAAHAEDYDDSATAIIGGHASAVLVPVALALGEQVGAAGSDVMLAAACGYEVAFAVGEVVNPYHYETGFHPTSTIGTVAAAATAGYLLDLTPAQQAHALALACSMSSGLKGNFASMAKALHCGWAASSGITAAQLAAHGMTGNLSVFEGRQGFSAVYGGPDAKPARMLLGESWYLEDPGIGLRKAWACCASIHASIEASIDIRRANHYEPEDIKEIISLVPGRRIPHTDRPDAATPSAARFSNQYCVAASLVHGELAPRHFGADAIADERVRALMRLVRLEHTAAMDDRDPDMRHGDDFAATVIVRLSNGDELRASVDAPLGTRKRPLSRQHLETKFAACVEPAVGAAKATRLSTLVRELEWATDLSGILLDLDAQRVPEGAISE